MSALILVIVGALTLVLAGVLLWALRTIGKLKSTISLLQGAVFLPRPARRLAKL